MVSDASLWTAVYLLTVKASSVNTVKNLVVFFVPSKVKVKPHQNVPESSPYTKSELENTTTKKMHSQLSQG